MVLLLCCKIVTKRKGSRIFCETFFCLSWPSKSYLDDIGQPPGLNNHIGNGSGRVGDQVVSLSMIRVKSMILRTEEGDPSRLEMTLVEISTLDSMIMLSRLVSLG